MQRYHSTMALNIKDPETERLAAELASRLSTTKTGAIRDALRTRLAALREPVVPSRDALARHLRMLESEIWAVTEGTAPITKREREKILGYGTHGV
jgi:antitoxin VapB